MLKQGSKSQRHIIMMIVLSVIMAVVLPLLFKLVDVAVAWRVGLLFIVMDGGFAWAIGRMIKVRQLPWWLMLIFPVLFAGMVYWRYAQYNYWFAPIYVILSVLALTKD